MKHYRQYDYTEHLGVCGNETIRSAGCFVTSLANLCGKLPPEVNLILGKGGCFTSCNMLIYKEKASKLLGIEYDGITNKKPNYICIAETKDTKAPQHFFVYNPETDEMNDPISSVRGWEDNKYNIVSYRLFKEREGVKMSKEDYKIIDELKNIWESQENVKIEAQDTQNRCHNLANLIRGKYE